MHYKTTHFNQFNNTYKENYENFIYSLIYSQSICKKTDEEEVP